MACAKAELRTDRHRQTRRSGSEDRGARSAAVPRTKCAGSDKPSCNVVPVTPGCNAPLLQSFIVTGTSAACVIRAGFLDTSGEENASCRLPSVPCVSILETAWGLKIPKRQDRGRYGRLLSKDAKSDQYVDPSPDSGGSD